MANSSQVSITVDHRERRTAVVRALASRWEAAVTFASLPVGDYVIEERITVERKNATDLWRSLMNGRLFSQVARLKRSGERPVLVVEGATGNEGWQRDTRVESALRSLAVVWYLPILYTETAEATAELLVHLGRLWLRDTRQVWRPPERAPRRPERVPARMLGCIRGVGPDRAAALLARFGTLEAIVHASTRDLAAVPGIGSTLATRLHGAFRARVTREA